MKSIYNLLLLVFLLTISGFSFTQIKAGTIQYERKIILAKRNNYGIMFSGNFEMPKYEINFYTLSFSDSTSIFTPNQGFDDQGFGLSTHVEYEMNSNTKARKIMIKSMLETVYLSDTLSPIVWKITGNKRKIAGFNCRKAIWEKNDSTRVYAWFTEAIEPAIGPDGFSYLPGAILGLASEDGSIVYFATSVEARKVEENKLYIDFNKRKGMSTKSYRQKNKEKTEMAYILKLILADILWY
jgi:GLPGLI family protein